MRREFDVAPLFADVDERTAKAYRTLARDSGFAPDHTKGAGLRDAIVIVFVGAVATALAALGLSAQGAGRVVAIAVVVVGVAAIVFGALLISRARRSVRRQWPELAARARFAEANRLDFIPSEDGPDRRGIIFQFPKTTAYNVFREWAPSTFEFGNFTYWRTPRRRASYPVNWAYLSVVVTAKQPRVIVRPRSAGRAGYYAASGLKQKTSDDRRFRVYAPSNKSVVAHDVFRTELLDLAARERLTLELVDDRVFAYRTVWFDFAKPSTMTTVEEILRALENGVVR